MKKALAEVSEELFSVRILWIELIKRHADSDGFDSRTLNHRQGYFLCILSALSDGVVSTNKVRDIYVSENIYNRFLGVARAVFR